MKKIVVFLCMFLIWFSINNLSFADFDSHDKSVDEIINNIVHTNFSWDKKQLDCSKVNDEQLEQIGDAVMSIMHPDPKQHKLMDDMMWGEWSKSLSAMHIMLWLNYLWCSSGWKIGMMWMWMMWGNSNWMWWYTFNNWFWNMMWYWLAGMWLFGGILMVLFRVIIIVAVIALIRFMSNKSNNEGSKPLQILEERYAKWEIDKKQFEEMKKELNLK